MGGNELKAGVQAKRFPIRESFRFGITDPGLNDPDSEAYNPNLAPFDLTRGGDFFNFNGEKTGQYYAGYVQDNLRWQNLENIGPSSPDYNKPLNVKPVEPNPL